MTLHELGIEDRDEQKFATRCPKCADTRQKTATNSLMVYKDEDGTRYECLHPTCEWFENRQFIKDASASPSSSKPAKMEFQIPVPDSAGPPPLSANAIKYAYRNVEGELLYYITRIDSPEGKRFFPMAYTTTGEWVAKRPTIKALYGAELLKDTSKPVIIVEGEKAKDKGQETFNQAIVISWPGGAANVKGGDWDLLKGRKVIIWPDNDEAGLVAARQIAALIPGDISIVDPSSLPAKADLGDDLTKEQIVEVWNTQVRHNRPEISGAYSAKDMQFKLSEIKTGESLGWANMRRMRLPASGMVVIEGRTGHGKTTMMANILAKKIQEGRSPLVFYSYEMPAERILLKTVMILDGRQLDEIPHVNEEMFREECLTGKNKIYNSLLEKLGSDLYITDAYLDIDQLMANLSSPHMRGAMVFVDYIQYIPAKNSATSRYLIIKEFADKIQNVSHKNKLVVFVGAQLTPGDKPEMDSPREGKDIHNSAELVIRIWNRSLGDTMGVTRKDLDGLPGNCVLDIRKNRNGLSGAKYCFDLVNGCSLQDINAQGAF